MNPELRVVKTFRTPAEYRLSIGRAARHLMEVWGLTVMWNLTEIEAPIEGVQAWQAEIPLSDCPTWLLP